MEEKNLICIGCPMGCPLTVKMEHGEVVSVTGNTCKRGDIYARKEVTNPTRIVTSTVRVTGGSEAMVSVKTATGEEKEVKEPDFSCGYITIIENGFAFKQDLPLVIGDNVIGRRNKDTEGVDVPIITSDPSMGRKHCVINVKKDANGKFVYMVRDFPSLTGTFVKNVLVGKKEQVRIGEGTIVTIGATTFILHSANEGEEEE